MKKATGIWLLRRRRRRTSFQSSIRRRALARISKHEGCGGGQECDRNCGGGRRASVALRIRTPNPAPACARGLSHRHRRTTAASRSKCYAAGALVRCHAARLEFEGEYTPGARRLYAPAGEQCLETPAGAIRARPEEPRRCERVLEWNSTSLARRSGVRSPWLSMIRLRRGVYPLTGNRPEPVVNSHRSHRRGTLAPRHTSDALVRSPLA